MWRPDGVILNRKMRPSNEAVWGGNFEDLKDPERGIRALRIRTLATLADRHTQISFSLLTRTLPSAHWPAIVYSIFWKDTHARLCCQVEKLLLKNHDLGLHTNL